MKIKEEIENMNESRKYKGDMICWSMKKKLVVEIYHWGDMYFWRESNKQIQILVKREHIKGKSIRNKTY